MVDQNLIQEKFKDIGVDVVFISLHSKSQRRRSLATNQVIVDVRQGKGDEFFEVIHNEDPEFDISVIDAKPYKKHLLMMVKIPLTSKIAQAIGENKVKLLCGNGESHNDAFCTPEKACISTVQEDKEALFTDGFNNAHKNMDIPKNLLKLKNEELIRQGEWLFLKTDDFVPDNLNLIKRDEPLCRRGRSKPYICEELYTVGGEKVYVHSTYAPNGVSSNEMVKIKQRIKEQGFNGIINFDSSTRNAKIYIRGRVKHQDHNTIHLLEWHRVLMNPENESGASWASAFLD